MSVDAIPESERAAPVHQTTDFDRPVYCMLGLPFDAVTLDAAVFLVGDTASRRQRFFFSTPNLNFVIGCQKDPQFRESVLQSDLSVADGMPLIWVARTLGLPFRERVAGSTIFENLRRSRVSRISVYFFGGPKGAGAKACDALGDEVSPGMTCAGFATPGYASIAELSTPEVIASINASGADLLVVALGARKGQEWIMRNREALAIPLVSHLGAVVNFVAGTVSRAPPFWQRLGFEWFWRIRQEPLLWRRYAEDGLYFLKLIVTQVAFAALDARYQPTREQMAASRAAATRGAHTVITISGDWTVRNLGPLRRLYADVASRSTDIVVDLKAIGFFDSAWVALLLLLRGHQGKVRRTLKLRSASRATLRRLAIYGVDYLDTGG